MNKHELISSIANKSNLSKVASEKALNALIEVIEEALSKGEKISLVDFGTFEAKIRAAKSGVNPRTKETIHIPEKIAPTFKAGKGFKDRINGKG